MEFEFRKTFIRAFIFVRKGRNIGLICYNLIDENSQIWNDVDLVPDSSFTFMGKVHKQSDEWCSKFRFHD